MWNIAAEKAVSPVRLKLVVVVLYFWQNGFETVLQGLMWQMYLFMQKDVFCVFFFLRSMAYYAFFIEGIEVARTDKMLMQNEKEKTSKMFTKNSK